MTARGPDASGLYAQARWAFGHRRLSILDLAATSQQPMIDNELGLGIVFNGCIYNFKELRAALTQKGYRFFSQGDTEVVLKAFHAWGGDCVTRFKGMFAFAVWERDSGRVTLARDRLGIKPLYYTTNGKRLRFASTLPALIAAGGVRSTLDTVALHYYFSFHAAVPAPRTILEGVKKVPPATLMTFEADGACKSRTYWHLAVGEAAGERMSREEAKSLVHDALKAAVERRRVADVPVGVLLSGGLDSSLIVALLAESDQNDLRTFAIGFESVDGHQGDEFKYSDIVARRFGTQHQQIRIEGSRALDALPEAMRAMSEPMVSHDVVAFYLLSQEVSRHVKVVQSGQGADEVFGGYSWYPAFMQCEDPVAEYEQRYFDWKHEEINQLLSRPISRNHSRELVSAHFAASASPRPIDKVLELDTEVMMIDDPVKRVDNMTMAFGLEARVPFLDHELVEVAGRLPAEFKLNSEGGKAILKDIARAILPPEIIDRPKGYFPVPALRHLRGPFLDYVREVLSQPAAKGRGLYRSEAIDAMLAHPDRFMSPKGHSRVWQAAVLENWLQAHGL